MTVAQQLAAFLTATSADTLPSQALDHAAMLVASTMASAACGASLESATIIRDLARERGGRQDASVWFAGDRLPVAEAAQVNAVMSDAAASDDSDLRNIVHCGTPLTAASLAMAEHTGASGEASARRSHPGFVTEASMAALARSSRRRRRRACFYVSTRHDWRRRLRWQQPRSAGWPPRRTRPWRVNTMPGWQRCWV